MRFIAYGLTVQNQCPLVHVLAMASSLEEVLIALNSERQYPSLDAYYYAYIADTHDNVTPLVWRGRWEAQT